MDSTNSLVTILARLDIFRTMNTSANTIERQKNNAQGT